MGGCRRVRGKETVGRDTIYMEVMDPLEHGHGELAKYLNRTGEIAGSAAIFVEARPRAQVSAAAMRRRCPQLNGGPPMTQTNPKGMRIQSQKKKSQDLVAHRLQTPVSRGNFLVFVEPPPT